MKKSHIIVIILLALSLGAVMVGLTGDNSYATFTEAFEKQGRTFTVVGQFNPDKPSLYDPEVDPNKFTFFLKDNDGVEREVVLTKAKPRDFERAEQIVLTGKVIGDQFVASKMLMKCPSKYNGSGRPESVDGWMDDEGNQVEM